MVRAYEAHQNELREQRQSQREQLQTREQEHRQEAAATTRRQQAVVNETFHQIQADQQIAGLLTNLLDAVEPADSSHKIRASGSYPATATSHSDAADEGVDNQPSASPQRINLDRFFDAGSKSAASGDENRSLTFPTEQDFNLSRDTA
jgi:hypothetical protein